MCGWLPLILTAFDHRRTVNIWYMSLTLAVSKLSGWLNDVASCQVKEGVERRVTQLFGARSDMAVTWY